MGIKISNLPPIVTPQTTDIFPVVQAGVTYKESMAQLADLFSTPQQVQSSAFNFAVSAGAADAYTVALDPVPVAYTDGLLVTLNANHDNTTGVPSLSVNGLPSKDIVLWGQSQLLPGDLSTGDNYILIYNASNDNFELINPSISTANTTLVQSNFYNYGLDGGIVDAYDVDLNPVPVSVTTPGLQVFFTVKNGNTNTGASTLTVNGETYPILFSDGTPLTGSEILENSICHVIYSSNFGGAWLLQNASVVSVSNPVSAFVVSTDSSLTQYTTINSAIAAAAATSPSSANPQTIWILPGTYSEDINFASYINLAAASGSINGGGVQVVGNATHASGDVSITNIKFSTDDLNPAISFTSAGSAKVQFFNCGIEAVGGTGISLNSAGTELFLSNTSVNSGVGGQCWDVLDGSVYWLNPVSTNVDTASNIGGGTFVTIGGLINDSYDITAGTPIFASYGTNFLSNFLPIFAISATASVSLIGGSLYTSGVGTIAVTGTGGLSYSGVNMGPNLNFSNFLTKTGQVLNVGNLSFDGNNSINNIDGGLWIGSASGNPGLATLTAGSGVTITNAANSITIAATSAPTNGTFTPTITFGGSGTGITYTTNNGFYSRVGDTVTFSIYIALSSKGSAAGAASINGLPLTSRTTGSAGYTIPMFMSGSTLPASILGFLTSASAGFLVQGQDPSGLLTLDDTYFVNNTEIFCSGSYLV
jgi:hypothetical protein